MPEVTEEVVAYVTEQLSENHPEMVYEDIADVLIQRYDMDPEEAYEYALLYAVPVAVKKLLASMGGSRLMAAAGPGKMGVPSTKAILRGGAKLRGGQLAGVARSAGQRGKKLIGQAGGYPHALAGGNNPATLKLIGQGAGNRGRQARRLVRSSAKSVGRQVEAGARATDRHIARNKGRYIVGGAAAAGVGAGRLSRRRS